jgi:hypothetical protein
MVSHAKKEDPDMPPIAPSHPHRNSTTTNSNLDAKEPANSPDMSDEESGPLSATSWHGQEPPSPIGSPKSGQSGDDDTGEQEDGPSLPVQKRRRVTRACDECRRKKIKCDGKQPCTHCSVYSYGKYQKRRFCNPLFKSKFLFGAMAESFQSARTTSRPTGAETRRHSISRLWKAACSGPSPSCASLFPKSTLPTPRLTRPSSRSSATGN